MRPSLLEGKVAIVTGASRGIGRAIALALAREGARVVAAARTLEDLEETARLAAGGVSVRVCDVCNERDVESTVSETVEQYGGLDIMCNNAGVAPQALLVDTASEVWDRTMETNLRGTFLGCKYAARRMIGLGRGGSVINLGSVNSFIGEKAASAYVASKGAVLMLTKNAAAELAEYGIRVNVICPGSTDTEMATSFLESVGGREAGQEWMRRYQPLAGMIPPEDIAEVAVFLASDASRSMTGTSVVVDGGLMASWDHGVD